MIFQNGPKICEARDKTEEGKAQLLLKLGPKSLV